MLHEQPSEKHIERGEANFTESDKSLSKIISKGEFSSMFHLKQKTIISRLAEALSSNGHEAISSLIDVVNYFFKAFQEAINQTSNTFNGRIITTCILSFFHNIVYYDSNDEYDSYNQRSKSK